MRKSFSFFLIIVFFFLTGCSLSIMDGQKEKAQQPDFTAVPATALEKLTGAAEMTVYPLTPMPAEVSATIDWTPAPGEIVASDAGKEFSIRVTSRISLILQEKEYPAADIELHCTPADALGRISNVPVVPAGYYVFRYEGVQAGTCTIRNGQFEITIKVVN